ncbi:HAMP domain-containing sensor histidine kinase [Actinoplanes sp. NPDC051411]|uniref:sensor histidine kinase n=1 Tax=Actinoplanes sp. NPDC051411 TaxID=3155522 RepID=UPI00341D411A
MKRGPTMAKSLLVKLLAVSAVVSVLSVAATAWLAVRTTTRAIQREQSQALTDDARIYDALLGYAATHHDWSGAAPLVGRLARQTGHRIALTDRARAPIADSQPAGEPGGESGGGGLPDRASATVDPLGVDTDLTPAASDDRIDPRAVGPFRLTEAERTRLHGIATRVVACLREPPTAPAPAPVGAEPVGGQRAEIRNAEIVDEPNGRPSIKTPGSDLATDTACAGPRANLDAPAATEQRALDQLDRLVNGCLRRSGIPAVRVGLEQTWTWADPASARSAQGRSGTVADCLAASRREQLAAYVAPPALLYVTTPGAPAPSGFDLSVANRGRIIAVTALVLLVAVVVTTLVGMRLVRPLRALTAAAGRMRDGDDAARVAVTGRDEIARLGTAFNDMAGRRRQVEELRRAMVGDIAHEMRTPVTNIRGWLEAAEDGVVPLDRELMSSLLEEALLLQHVIDDLQDLSAADAGELRLHPQPVDLADLLPAVADAFAASADRAGVTLAVHAPSALVTADPIRLRQAVGNLVTNAIRHTPAGGSVTVSSRTEPEAQVIDVADTGPGLSAAERALVFERFWRAEKSRSRQTGGSGLGLSIVRKLVEAHGGTASVASEPGEGATFTLRLPR